MDARVGGAGQIRACGHRVVIVLCGGAGRGRRWSIKRNGPSVTWRQFVPQNGDSSPGRHEAGRGDKAAQVCDVRMQEDGTSCHPSTCPTREDTLRDSRARGVGEKGVDSASGGSREASSGTTGDGNGFPSLKTFADEQYGSADC